jgi:hypothetical protein
MLATFLMAVVLMPILRYDMNFPKSAADGILTTIALAVFLLSKYRARRKKSN